MELSKMSITDIKEIIDKQRNFPQPLLESLAQDTRSGVKKIYHTVLKRIEVLEKEKKRLFDMLKFEGELWERGYSSIAGVDEVGRGPLAGPVVAGAVILKKGELIEGLNDSKKLSPQKRGELDVMIRNKAVAYAVGIVSPEEIDRINIYQASLVAMKKAIQNLNVRPQYLLVDATTLPGQDLPQKAIVRGDALSCSIAAASIVAKETRDRIMIQLDEIFPMYGFAVHKGYGTPQHLEALKKYGPCPIHRRSFARVCQNNT